MKQKIKNAIKNADISDEDWFEYILPMVEEYDVSVYATFKLEANRHSEVLLTTSETYRDELLAICDWDIWPKDKKLDNIIPDNT